MVRRIVFVVWGALLLITIAACAPAYEFHGTQLDPPLALGTPTLINQDGQTVSLNTFRGQWVLLFFGYTHCPDQCPLTLGEFKQVHDQLGVDASRVRFVMITVDPERDTPQVLKTYLAQFDASFQGLTGDASVLVSLYRKLGIAVQTASLGNGDPQTVHTESVFLLDGSGQLRYIYTEVPWQDIASDVRQMLHPSILQ